MTTILFLSVTTGSCSRMAGAFARTHSDERTEIYSAGLRDTPLHPLTVASMAEVGLDVSGDRSPVVSELPRVVFDIVVTLCRLSEEQCPVLPGNPIRLHWELTPPPEDATGRGEAELGAFRRSRDEVCGLVRDFFEKGYFAAFRGVRRYEAMVLDTISDGIIAHDMRRAIFSFNRAAEAITGYGRADVLGRDCHDVFPGSFCGGRCLFDADTPPPTETVRRELDIVTRDGEKRTVAATVSPVMDGEKGQIGVVVSFHDVTVERRLARRVGRVQSYSGIIGRDEAMLEVFDLIRDVAESDVPVLVQGESGTGKELVAAAIHNESPRANRLFVAVNCGALPETLLESELFGHVKGAFTGAIRDKKGRFELADGGTIFLDEIGDISPAMQVRLLRVLQEGTFERVGSEITLKVNVRVISATNKNLSDEIARGRFREDLYYRLNVVPIFLPPLRQRRNDIPMLVEHILREFANERGRSNVRISDAAMDAMLEYDWPGNVRELQNWIQFALVKCRGESIGPEHLPPMRDGRMQAPKRHHRRKLDSETVRVAIEESDGNKVAAAKRLGVSRATLYRFLDDQRQTDSAS